MPSRRRTCSRSRASGSPGARTRSKPGRRRHGADGFDERVDPLPAPDDSDQQASPLPGSAPSEAHPAPATSPPRISARRPRAEPLCPPAGQDGAALVERRRIVGRVARPRRRSSRGESLPVLVCEPDAALSRRGRGEVGDDRRARAQSGPRMRAGSCRRGPSDRRMGRRALRRGPPLQNANARHRSAAARSTVSPSRPTWLTCASVTNAIPASRARSAASCAAWRAADLTEAPARRRRGSDPSRSCTEGRAEGTIHADSISPRYCATRTRPCESTPFRFESTSDSATTPAASAGAPAASRTSEIDRSSVTGSTVGIRRRGSRRSPGAWDRQAAGPRAPARGPPRARLEAPRASSSRSVAIVQKAKPASA